MFLKIVRGSAGLSSLIGRLGCCRPRGQTSWQFETGPEVRQAGRLTSWRSGERLVVNQALSIMKSPQNYRGIPLFLNRRLNLSEGLAEAARCRNLNLGLVLSGDDQDRTGNLLVANQDLSPDSNRRNLLFNNWLRRTILRPGFSEFCQFFPSFLAVGRVISATAEIDMRISVTSPGLSAALVTPVPNLVLGERCLHETGLHPESAGQQIDRLTIPEL
jgi:hypothetical protein